MDYINQLDILSQFFGLFGSILLVKKIVTVKIIDFIDKLRKSKDNEKNGRLGRVEINEAIELYYDVILGTGFFIVSYLCQIFKLFLTYKSKIEFFYFSISGIVIFVIMYFLRYIRVSQIKKGVKDPSRF